MAINYGMMVSYTPTWACALTCPKWWAGMLANKDSLAFKNLNLAHFRWQMQWLARLLTPYVVNSICYS